MPTQDTSSNIGVAAITGDHTGGGDGVFGQTNGPVPGSGVHGASSTGRGVTGESADAEGVLGISNTGLGVLGSSMQSNGVQGISSDPIASGIYGENTNGGWGTAGRTNSDQSRAGVWGDNIGNGPGVLGTGLTGVVGTSTQPSGVGSMGLNNAGVEAVGILGSSTIGTGVRGLTFDGIAVHGVSQPTSGLAGKFDGDVQINGTLTKSGGAFIIDHPIDPANKYLRHSFVESPDMMNIYNGIAFLDESGEVTVELPTWFDVLNQDIRYVLTPIGQPGPNLYIADEVERNRFRIAGGAPNMKISWQITGIRKDPYAVQHRVRVEEEKPEGERGKYLHPHEYGLAEALGIDPNSDLQMQVEHNSALRFGEVTRS